MYNGLRSSTKLYKCPFVIKFRKRVHIVFAIFDSKYKDDFTYTRLLSFFRQKSTSNMKYICWNISYKKKTRHLGGKYIDAFLYGQFIKKEKQVPAMNHNFLLDLLQTVET